LFSTLARERKTCKIASCVGGDPSGSKDGGKTPKKHKTSDKEKRRRHSAIEGGQGGGGSPPPQTRGGHKVYKVVVLGDGGVGKSGKHTTPRNPLFSITQPPITRRIVTIGNKVGRSLIRYQLLGVEVHRLYDTSLKHIYSNLIHID